MPATLESPPVAKIDRQLTQAAGRIRTTDLLTGILTIVAFTLTYAAGMILLDRYLGLANWVRQLGFVSWLGMIAVIFYQLIVRPLARVVNPLYVAKKVESAIPDAKNVVVNYVDLKDSNLPASIRSAVAGRASAEVTDADVHHAGESKRLIQLGVLSASLGVMLAILFLVFSPAQFNSLVKRTFQPFASTQIISKTRLTVTYPNDPDFTVTAGQPVLLQVTVEGRLPSVDGSDRVRLMLRHNPEDPTYHIENFEPGGTNREFQIKVPEYLVQNGFWYKVAGGDGETSEHHVAVRPRPLILGFSVTYEYPKYLRMPSETLDRPQIEAYRGTKITLTAKTNRPLRDGRMLIEGQNDIQPGSVAAEDSSWMRYTFIVKESGTYRLYFTTTDGEPNIDPPIYPIKVIVDNPPAVIISKPESDDVEIAANGRLEIDATATDDLGISKLTIKSRLLGTTPTPLQDKNYALQLKREDDQSFPTRVEMKDGVSLSELKTEAGGPIQIKEGDVLEYWIEALDNCEVPQPQLGKSTVKRVKILAPIVEPEKKKAEDQKNEERKTNEQKQVQQQKNQFDNEKRPPPAGQKEKNAKSEDDNPDQSDNKQENGDQKSKTGEQSSGQPKPMSGDQSNPMSQRKNPESSDAKQPPMGSEQSQNSEKTNPNPQTQPMGNQSSNPNQKPDPKQQPMGSEQQNPSTGNNSETTAEQKQQQEIQRKADQVQQELNKQNPNSQQSNNKQNGQPTKEQIEDFKKAAQDLNSADPQKREAAEKKIDQMIGEDARKQAQQESNKLKNDLNSPDEKTRQEAQKKVEKMAEQMKQNAGENSQPNNQPPTKEQIEEMKKTAQDLNSADPKTKQNAEQKLDQMMGKKNREKAQKEAEKLKNDLNSPDENTRKNAQEKVEKIAEQMVNQQKNHSNSGGQNQQPPTKEQIEEMKKTAQDLNSTDPKTKQNAEQKLDQMMGKDNRVKAQQEAEKLKNDLNSPDENTRKNAQEKVEKMAEQMAKQGGGQNQQKPTKEQIEDLKKAAQDAASNDPETKKKGEAKLDEMIGKDAREKAQKDAEQLKKDLASNDQKTRQNAEQKVKDMADKMAQAGGEEQPKSNQQNGNSQKMTEEQKQKMAEAAKDLNSNDPAKKQAAEKTLDEMIGKDARLQAQKDAEQLKNDLASNDKQTREAAEKKMKDMADKMANEAGNQKPDPKNQNGSFSEDKKKEIADAMNKLNSADANEKKAAQDSLDKNIGEENRKKAEKLQEDMKSNNPAVREEAKKKAEQMANQGGQKQGENNDKGLSPEDAQKLAEKAKDLNSKDEKKRKDAEKELDEKIGKESREKLQKTMENLASNDPQKLNEAAKQLEEWRNQAQKHNPNQGQQSNQWNPGGSSRGTPGGPALEDNPADRLKTHELQLETFKKNKNNKALQEKLGYTQEEYDRFVKGYESLVEAERKQIQVNAKASPNATAKSINTNRGGEKIETRGADGAGPQGSNAGTAPPGYSDASKKFAEEAAKKKGNR